MAGQVTNPVRRVPGETLVQPARNGDGLRFNGITSGHFDISPAAIAGTVSVTAPTALVAGCLAVDALGQLSFESVTTTRNRLGLGIADAVTFGNLTVSDLTVNGTTTTINSTVIAVTDPLIKLATSNPADLLDIGLYGTYVSTGTKYTGLFRDASDSGKYKLFTGLTEEPTTTVNVAGTGYTAGYLVVGTIEATTYVGYPATNPAGTGTELQYRASATAFGAVTGSSFDGATLTLANPLTIRSDTTGSLLLTQASGDTDAFDLNFRKSRGTLAVPTVITTGDVLGTVTGYGYSGVGGYVAGAQIRFESTGTIASTRVPGKIVFATGTDATPSVLTDRMTILNSGNVGIGTASPGAQLQVNAGASTTIGQIIKGAASQSGNLTEWQNSAGTALTVVDENGNVGIGTASSQTKLEVVGDANTFIMRAPTASSYGSFRIYNDQNSGSRALEIGYGGSQAGLLLIDGIYGETAYITTTGAKAIQFGTGNTYRMGIDTNGLVGINKSSSIGAQLHVVPSSSTTIGQIIQGAASQSANLQEWQNSAGTVLASMTAAGIFGGSIQRLKASYNNWAALSDVVNALVATGLFDQA